MVGMVMKFDSGAMATVDVKTITATKFHHHMEQRIEVYGSKGVILVSSQYPQGTSTQVIKSDGSNSKINKTTLSERDEQTFINAVEHFLDLTEGVDEAKMNVLDTLRVTSIATMCETSHRSTMSKARDNVDEQMYESPESLLETELWKERPDICLVDPKHPMARTHV